MFRCNQRNPFKPLRVVAALLAVCLLLMLVVQSRAQGPNWQLKISEKELQLANPTDPMWMKSNMWDISFQRMHDRNMPTLELTNLQAAGSPDITKLTLSIGDTRFHFSDDVFNSFIAQCPCAPSANINDPTPDGLTLTSSVSDGGNLLTVNIAKQGGGGLAPGEVVRFKIDIDVDAGFNFFQHPDFRTVLFDMNGVQVYGPDPNIPAGQNDNAQATVTFSNGNLGGPATFIDEIITGPQGDYFNNVFRPYGVMEPVDTFVVSGGPTIIPEPTSGLLALFGLLGVSGYSARKRRAPLAA
jgi:hypothetical protein